MSSKADNIATSILEYQTSRNADVERNYRKEVLEKVRGTNITGRGLLSGAELAHRELRRMARRMAKEYRLKDVEAQIYKLAYNEVMKDYVRLLVELGDMKTVGNKVEISIEDTEALDALPNAVAKVINYEGDAWRPLDQ